MRRDNPDSNAAELLDSLEKNYGWSYRRIARAKEREKGIFDSIVSRRGDPLQRNHLLEVKRLGGRLSEPQVEFARIWHGCKHVATNSWEANELLKECEAATTRLLVRSLA